MYELTVTTHSFTMKHNWGKPDRDVYCNSQITANSEYVKSFYYQKNQATIVTMADATHARDEQLKKNFK